MLEQTETFASAMTVTVSLTHLEIAKVATGLVRKMPSEWVQSGVVPFYSPRALALVLAGVEAVPHQATWMETVPRYAKLVGPVPPPLQALAVHSPPPPLADLEGHHEYCCNNPWGDISGWSEIKTQFMR